MYEHAFDLMVNYKAPKVSKEELSLEVLGIILIAIISWSIAG